MAQNLQTAQRKTPIMTFHQRLQ